MAKIQTVSNTSVIRKEYKYALGNVELNFTLRNDNTDELIKFQQLILSAQTEIAEDILKIQRSRKHK